MVRFKIGNMTKSTIRNDIRLKCVSRSSNPEPGGLWEFAEKLIWEGSRTMTLKVAGISSGTEEEKVKPQSTQMSCHLVEVSGVIRRICYHRRIERSGVEEKMMSLPSVNYRET